MVIRGFLDTYPTSAGSDRELLPSCSPPESGQISQYKRVYRYRSGETVNFPQADFWGVSGHLSG
jgi:hypothetical protein